MESPLKSSPKSHRVRDFLPSVKPSYLSLILVLLCGMNHESTNDRLKLLEKQMKILSASKSCVDTSSPSILKMGVTADQHGYQCSREITDAFSDIKGAQFIRKVFLQLNLIYYKFESIYAK